MIDFDNDCHYERSEPSHPLETGQYWQLLSLWAYIVPQPRNMPPLTTVVIMYRLGPYILSEHSRFWQQLSILGPTGPPEYPHPSWIWLILTTIVNIGAHWASCTLPTPLDLTDFDNDCQYGPPGPPAFLLGPSSIHTDIDNSCHYGPPGPLCPFWKYWILTTIVNIGAQWASWIPPSLLDLTDFDNDCQYRGPLGLLHTSHPLGFDW